MVEWSGDIRKTLWSRCEYGLSRYPSICPQECWIPPAPLQVKTEYFEITRVSKEVELCDSKSAVYLMGPTVYGCKPLVFRNCVHSEYMAVVTRVGKPQDWQGSKSVSERWKATQRKWRRTGIWNEIRVRSLGVVPVSFEYFLEGYSSGRKKELVHGKEIADAGIKPEHFTMKAFVKMEVLPWAGGCKVDRKPRLIQGRHDAITATTGPYMLSIKNPILEALASQEYITIAVGWNAESAGHWYKPLAEAGMIAIEFDISAFDTAVSDTALSTWTSDTERICKDSDVLKILNTRNSIQKGTTRRGIKYKRLGQVSSGDADTSLGNSVLHAKVWNEVLTVWLTKHKTPFRVAIMGDDSVVSVGQSYVQHMESLVPQIFKEHGFKVTLEHKARSIFDAGFCSQRFVPVQGGWILAPKLGRVLSKTFWSLTNWGRSQPSYAKAVAQSLENAGMGLPVFRVLVSVILSKTRHRKALQLPNIEHKIVAQVRHSVSETSWLAFCSTYSLSREQVLELEMRLSVIDLVKPQHLRLNTLAQIVERDIADLTDL